MLKIYQNQRFHTRYHLIANVKIEGFVTFFYEAPAMETLSFYKLYLYTEDFKLLGFPPWKGCPISPYGGQGGLTILRTYGTPLIRDFFFHEISHVLGTFEFLHTFLPILGLCIFTDFPLYWGLCVCTIPPCAEDFSFYDISYLLETVSF